MEEWPPRYPSRSPGSSTLCGVSSTVRSILLCPFNRIHTQSCRIYSAAWPNVTHLGHVMSFRVYNTRIIVLNSYRAIHDLLDGRAPIYSNRPFATMLHDPKMCDRGKTVFNVSATHPRHRKYRKILQTGLSLKATKEYESLLVDEAKVLVDGLAATPKMVEDLVRR